jgi:TolB protein
MVLVVALFALAACVGEPLTNETTTSTTIAMAATSPESDIDSGSLRGTIVYSTDIAGNDDVFLVTPPDGEPVQLTKGPEKEFDPDLSPDGASIAYRVNPDPESDEADIWVMDLDGGKKRNLTNSPQLSNWAPAWTPDGEIVFSSMRGGSGALELWSMTADGSDLRQVSEGWCEYPDVSPDGSEFVCSTAVGGRYDLLVVDGATGARRALTTTPETEFGPTWSPDGQWIVFSRDTGEHWELLRIRPDGSDEEHIAKEGVFATWDPDGHLVWSGEGGINIARVDGSGLVVLDYPAGFMSWGESGSLFPGFDLAGDRRRVEPGVLVFDQAISEVE